MSVRIIFTDGPQLALPNTPPSDVRPDHGWLVVRVHKKDRGSIMDDAERLIIPQHRVREVLCLEHEEPF